MALLRIHEQTVASTTKKARRRLLIVDTAFMARQPWITDPWAAFLAWWHVVDQGVDRQHLRPITTQHFAFDPRTVAELHLHDALPAEADLNITHGNTTTITWQGAPMADLGNHTNIAADHARNLTVRDGQPVKAPTD